MKKLFTIISMLSAALLMTGCISTNVKGFTDDQYKSYKLKKVAIQAVNTNFHFGEMLENSMVEELNDENVKAKAYSAIFPPTQQRNFEEISKKLLSMGFDAIMQINFGSSKASSYSDEFYVPTGYDSLGNNYGTNVSVSLVWRNTSAQVRIYSIKSGKTVWAGDTHTKAGGLFYMSDESTTDSIAEDVVDTLEDSGHL